MTNGDWLRSKGDEELAELIVQGEVYSRALAVVDDNGGFIVKQSIIEWLKAEHGEG